MTQLLIGNIRGIIRGTIDLTRTSALALLFSALPLLTIQVQTATAQTGSSQTGSSQTGSSEIGSIQTKPAGPFTYDAAEEVTLNGTVSSVVVKASLGMFPGSHLLLTTVDGAVDISLGTAVRQGAGALSLTAGQQVEVVGIMKTINQKQIFIARSVQAGSHLYVIRNQHGIPVSPIGRERTTQNAGHDGDTL
jgi:hypothetical protein